MFKRIILACGWSAVLAVPATAEVSNGFDSNKIYALNGEANNPFDLLLSHSKTSALNLADNWTEVGIPQNTATSGRFIAHHFTSLTFSCSTAGANTPAGYRLFYLGRETAPEFDTYLPILVEVDSNCNELREAYLGRIVTGTKNFGGANDVRNWPHVNLRYNAKNNTLMVGISHNGAGTGGIRHGYIYEFTLPDSPVGTGVEYLPGFPSPNETQGITLMETYDTGVINADPDNGFNINVAPDGTLYFRQAVADTDVYSFSTAGGTSPGGTTSSPTLIVTSTTLKNAVPTTLGNWQSAIYRPVSNSLVNLQRRTNPPPPTMALVDYSLTTHTATLIPGSSGIRGQENGSLDAATGDIWIASQNYPVNNGGTWKYTAAGALIHWDTLSANDGGRALFDIAVPPPGPGACCTGVACDDLHTEGFCTGASVWHGVGTTCDSVVCCPNPFADADGDGDVDQDDFAALQACINYASILPGCDCFNRDGDTDVDHDDFDAFKACVTGPMIPFNPLNPPPGCSP